MEWILGFYTEDRGVFVDRTLVRLAGLDARVAADRPRILIKGAALNDSTLHRTVEAAGGYVIAEDDWRGSRAAGDGDVRTDVEPAVAIFEKYHFDEMSPRIQPSRDRDVWFHREMERVDVDGVLFYIPLQDDVVGWDLPRHSAWLQQRDIPGLVVRDCGNAAAIEEFVESMRRK